MLCVVLLGRQGAGKGTQSALIVQKYGCVHVSTGDMLRSAVAAQSELGIKAEALMSSGQLVGDDVIIGIVAERFQDDDVKRSGVLLDGFPRTLDQANALENILLTQHNSGITIAVNLEVPITTVTERMLQRGRFDDTAEAIARRLEEYEIQTFPLLDWFKQRNLLCKIDGSGTVEEVFEQIVETIDKRLMGSLASL